MGSCIRGHSSQRSCSPSKRYPKASNSWSAVICGATTAVSSKRETAPSRACSENSGSRCRKIFSPAHRGQIAARDLVLAPVGTKFDRMWFTQTDRPLVVFDGSFPSTEVGGLGTAIERGNKPGSIAGDPTSTLARKLDIPVLGKAPTPFRLLAPHQDTQFVCDRPFFYVDRQRAFMVTSTGRTTSTGGIRGIDWARANVGAMYRAEFFPNAPRPPESPRPLTPLTLLLLNDRGQRIEKQLPAVDLQPLVPTKTLLPTFVTSRRYQFESFSHPFVCRFVQTLDRDGIPGLISLETQRMADDQAFAAYAPLDNVDEPHPIDEVDFASGSAFDVYNWELFFHIPLLVAERLRANQRFADARKWFHYIFDPTGSSTGHVPQRFWRMKPFHDRLAADYAAESVAALEEMAARGPSQALLAAIATWRDNPFSPHAIARLRTTAYQKAVVMKYIDNLIEYGDQLFSRDTLETINEATQLYVLAAEILGKKPEEIDRGIRPAVATFNSLELVPGGLGNALEQLELFATTNDSTTIEPAQPAQPFDVPATMALVFCVPENAKLLDYWGTVADRLCKIRHCMNIAGQVRQLPLFEPPIDPALLVRARAAGLSISEIVSNVRPVLPSYRFSTMLARANELAAEVKSLGAALLSIVEKRDAEALSTLRSRHEMRLLQAIRDVRKSQIDEAKSNIAALIESRKATDTRKTFFDMDMPGHLFRRIKSVSVTIPCVTGPFTTVHCKLALLASSYRRSSDLNDGYVRKPAGEVDARFIDDRKINEAIVTSTGQNDAGVFELNLRDERYMPFEGAGVISQWRFELPTDFKTFDYATISDVVLHVRYTARDGGEALRAAATDSVETLLGSDESPLFRLISVRHDFPAEWHALVSSGPASTSRAVTIDLSAARFPFFTHGRQITIKSAIAQLAASSNHVAIKPGSSPPVPDLPPFHGSAPPGPWTIATDAQPAMLDDIVATFAYSVQ